MPQLDLATPTGPVKWHYNISTPTLAFSPTIVPELPCVLFLHGEYMAQDIFESQFSDPQLRKHLNLIAVDFRQFGSTRGPITEGYTSAAAADDVYRFMQALQLPPVHVFALSMGCCIALELAVAHPHLLRSLTLFSPLSLSELEDVAFGRVELYKYWEQALFHEGPHPAETSDQSMLDDLVRGVQQFMFNDEMNRMIHAMTRYAISWVKETWAGSAENLKAARTRVDWVLDRKPLPLASLAKITCPIRLIHCADDVSYPINYIRELQSYLREAGCIDVFLYQFPGPHFGHVLNPQAINPVLHNFVFSVENHEFQPESLPEGDLRKRMVTPFTAALARYGYDPFADSDEESDSE